MNVLGLDLALTATGIAWPDGSTTRIVTAATLPLEQRLDHIVKSLAYGLGGWAVDLVVVEDLPRNARGAGSTGPVHGVVRWWLHRKGWPIVTVTAASVKKYALGKGGGAGTDKDAMGIAAMRRVGLDFSGRADECDAWWLRAMALDAYGLAVVDLPAAHRQALVKVAWPELAVAA